MKMDIELKVELRKAINNFINKTSEHSKRGDYYIPDRLAEKMTDAAEAVYDQNTDTESWLREQGHLKD
jgi:hypothetical protein